MLIKLLHNQQKEHYRDKKKWESKWKIVRVQNKHWKEKKIKSWENHLINREGTVIKIHADVDIMMHILLNQMIILSQK